MQGDMIAQYIMAKIPGEAILAKQATIHQVTIMLTTSRNVLFPGHNHLLTTGTDDPSLWLLPSLVLGDNKSVKCRVISSAGGYDLEKDIFRGG